MSRGYLRRGICLAFLYVGVFIVIVLVQFSKGPGFSRKIGGLSVSATIPKTEPGRTVSPEKVRISYAGMTIELSELSPAELVVSHGAVKTVLPRSVEAIDNGAQISLSSGHKLIAAVEFGARERFTLTLVPPAGGAAAELRLPLSARSAVPYVSNGKHVLSSGGGSFDVSLVSAAVDHGSLVIEAGAPSPGYGSVSITRVQKPAARPPRQAEKLLARQPKSDSEFAAIIASWRDKAWASLSGSRLDAKTATWKGPDGTPVFSEKALAAYLAESLVRGNFAAALEVGKTAKKSWPDKLTELTAPYIGGLMPRMQAREAADASEVKRLSQMIASASPALCEKEGLVTFLLDRAPATLAPEALRALAAFDPAKLSLRQAVGLLGCVVEAQALLPQSDNPLADIASLPARLLAAVREAPEGLFLVAEEDGSCDLRLSVLAGRYLMAFGASTGKPDLVGIGQGLVEAGIAVSDDQAFAPARLTLRSGAVDLRMGTIAPEDLYPVYIDNPYYTREVSLYREAGPGVWAWTCSPSITYKKSESESVFLSRFPEGLSHYLTLYGIEPFAVIQLYGIDYSADRQFEIYNASGYVFDAGRKTLYLKMKHKRESEDIRLLYKRNTE